MRQTGINDFLKIDALQMAFFIALAPNADLTWTWDPNNLALAHKALTRDRSQRPGERPVGHFLQFLPVFRIHRLCPTAGCLDRDVVIRGESAESWIGPRPVLSSDSDAARKLPRREVMEIGRPVRNLIIPVVCQPSSTFRQTALSGARALPGPKGSS